jgi:hypothetical protein
MPPREPPSKSLRTVVPEARVFKKSGARRALLENPKRTESALKGEERAAIA